MADCGGCIGKFSVYLSGYFIVTAILVCAKQEVLLDSTKFQRLNWTTKIVKTEPPDDTSKDNKGWNEVSANDHNNVPIKVYLSCYVTSRNVNNWLRTPFIDVGRANSLNLEMKFTMRKCQLHNNPEALTHCQETFTAYRYEMENDFANADMPSWDDFTYKMVDKIPAKRLSETTTDMLINTETRFVPLEQGLRGVYFAFQDTGSCVTLMSIRIYYRACPNITDNFAQFPETPTGKTRSAPVLVHGTCVENADLVTLPSYRCMPDESWDIPQGECQCRPGFEGVDRVKCLKCKPGQYKSSGGNHVCLRCPNNSFTDVHGSDMCDCLDNYYRAPSDDKGMPCTQPPAPPTSLRKGQVTDRTIELFWELPTWTGGRSDVTYSIQCPLCDPAVMVSPKPSGFNTTSAELSGLKPSSTYSIKVCAENGISAISTHTACAAISVTTENALAETTKLTAVSVGDDHITIIWDVNEETRSLVTEFSVLHYVKGRAPQVTNHTTEFSFTLRSLLFDTQYVFQVRGKTPDGWGQYSKPLTVRTGEYVSMTTDVSKNEAESGPSVVIIVGAIVAVILCMAIAAVMIFILLRRNQRRDGKNPDIDGPYHHVLHCPPMEPHINGSMTMPLFQPAGTIKSYVDPHTYEDPNQAVREFTREIDASHVTIESVIGGGEFGDVCKGKLRIPQRPEMTVAIKTLKPGATDKNRLDFLTEASIMGQFDDPNVIFLEGVMTKSHPIMIVTEYMSNGSLDTFLRKNDGHLTVIQLVGMMRGIASGMRYLSEMGYVHRDLAARNILINDTLVCKVADFGLSREIDIDTTDGAYTTKGGKIPVRWTAPEAISFRKFTSASDVWSYGVLMWEVISYGERPYWNWSNQDVIKAVEKGYRLPPPMDCPEAIHQLMLEAWQKDRSSRPKFSQIVKTIDKLIRAPEVLRKMAKPRPQVFIDNTQPDMTNFSSVEEWLNVIKMERYADSFLHAGITSMEQVIRLTVKDLDTLGVTLLGHQKKVMNSVQTLRAQLLGPQVHLPHMQVSEGFLV